MSKKFPIDISLPNQWTDDEDPNDWAAQAQGYYKELYLLKTLRAAEADQTIDELGQQLLEVVAQTALTSRPLPSAPAGPVAPVVAETPDAVVQLYDLIIRARTYDASIQEPNLVDLRKHYGVAGPELEGALGSWRGYVDAKDAENILATQHGDPNPTDGTNINDATVVVKKKKKKAGKVVMPDGRAASSLTRDEIYAAHKKYMTHILAEPAFLLEYSKHAHPLMLAFGKAGSPDPCTIQRAKVLGRGKRGTTFKRAWIRDDFAVITPVLAGEQPDADLLVKRSVPSGMWSIWLNSPHFDEPRYISIREAGGSEAEPPPALDTPAPPVPAPAPVPAPVPGEEPVIIESRANVPAPVPAPVVAAAAPPAAAPAAAVEPVAAPMVEPEPKPYTLKYDLQAPESVRFITMSPAGDILLLDMTRYASEKELQGNVVSLTRENLDALVATGLAAQGWLEQAK